MTYLLGLDSIREPFCINASVIVDIREERSLTTGQICGSKLFLDARKSNLTSTFSTLMLPSQIDAALGIGSSAVVPLSASHPPFISVPVMGHPKQAIRVGVASIMKMEPIIADGHVKGTNIYRHAKTLNDSKPVATSLTPSALYRMLNIPDPTSGRSSEFVFLPVAQRIHHPDCYARALVLKINPHKDFNRKIIGTTLLLDPGGLQKTNAIEMLLPPLEVYKLFGLHVPADVAQYYHPKKPSLKTNFPLASAP